MPNIQQMLDEQGVEYRTHGPNIARESVGIACPFCGDDPSQHMNITVRNLDKVGWWFCFRCREGGRSPHKLFMKLMGWSFADACAVLGHPNDTDPGDVSEFETLMNDEYEARQERDIRSLELPASFKRLWVDAPHADPYRRYLESRKFTGRDVKKVGRRYKLFYATAGAYAQRLIFPIYFEERLVCWTGRAIGSDEIRYKTTGFEEAVQSPSTVLYRYDKLAKMRGEVLVITEGPMDAIKVDFYGAPNNVRATCLFGKTPTETQIELLSDLKSRFDEFVVLLDAREMDDAWSLRSELRFVDRNIQLGTVAPLGVEDPGDLRPWAVRRLIKNDFYCI